MMLNEHGVLNYEDDEDDVKPNIEEIGDNTLSEDQKHEMSLKDCPIVRVTVFQSDRALITRQVKLEMKVQGDQLVTLKDLAQVAIENSIRVSGVGHATIQDVTVKKKTLRVKNDQTNVEKLKKQLKENENARKQLEAAKTRLDKEREFLRNYSKSVIDVSNNDHDVGKLLDPKTLQSMTEFSQFVSNELKRIEEQDVVLTKQDKELRDKRTELLELLSKENPAVTKSEQRFVELSLNASQPGQVDLQFNYMVSNARWYPLYDIRVTSREDKFELTYYGNIVQHTMEDWTDANINLSTADPTDRSSPPEMGTMTLHTEPKDYYQTIVSVTSAKKASFGGLRREEEEEEDYDVSFDEKEKSFSRDKQAVVAQTSTAQRGTTCTMFHITRAATIPSDGSPHKVTITVLKLESSSSHYTVPKLDANAYVKVKAINDSDFPLLMGSTSVFVDNNFVATGHMSNVNPMEEFESFLGQDPSVKVEYKAPSKFRETVGLMKGMSMIRMERKTVVKNSKEIAIELILTDQIPKSEDEKIKVKLLYPEFPSSQEDKQQIENVELIGTQDSSIRAKKVTLNNENILEWTIQVPAKKEITVSIKYTITWPVGSNINDQLL